MTAKDIGCPLDTADVGGCGLFGNADHLAAHLYAVHGTDYERATGSTLSQDECDALGLDGRDGTGEYTLANMPHGLRDILWGLRGGTLRAVRFEFDDSPAFDGITDDSTWNGWLNVKVTPDTRDAIVAHFDAQFRASAYGKYIGSRGRQYIAPDRDDWIGGIDTIPVGPDGLVDLGGGFATREVDA